MSKQVGQKSNQVGQQLNTLLCDYAVAYQKMRNYHWNVRGRRFFQLHEEFEKLYTQTSEWVDAIAERVARLEGHPYSTYAAFIKNARLKEDPEVSKSSKEMVQSLLKDIESLDKYASEVIEAAEEAGDVATANLLEDIVQHQEEDAWMLKSWLEE